MRKINLKKKFKDKSRKWIMRQMSDYYYLKSKKLGLRSRSAFKLIHINEKFNIFFNNANVLDLGSAPGGWVQIVKKNCKNGKILGIDLLEIKKIDGVHFIKHDLQKDDLTKDILCFFGEKVDIVLSDMAPNTIGHTKTDHLRIISLVETALDISEQVLKCSGIFVCKLFQGGAQNNLLKRIKKNFTNIKYYKPKSSRSESSETYLIGKKT